MKYNLLRKYYTSSSQYIQLLLISVELSELENHKWAYNDYRGGGEMNVIKKYLGETSTINEVNPNVFSW